MLNMWRLGHLVTGPDAGWEHHVPATDTSQGGRFGLINENPDSLGFAFRSYHICSLYNATVAPDLSRRSHILLLPYQHIVQVRT